MTVEGQPADAEALPHTKTYDFYVRIVEPGRHVFMSRMRPRRLFYAMAGFGAAGLLDWIGFRAGSGPRSGGFDIALMWFAWICGLTVAVASAWLILRDTIVEITPRQMTLKRRRFVRWRKSEWELSSFLEARLQPGPAFCIAGGPMRYVPRIVFDFDDVFEFTDKNLWMSEALDSKQLAEEFIQDINASVERARRAPATF